MGLKINVDISGLQFEVKQSKQYPRLLKEGLVDLIEESAQRVMLKVKSIMPVDTGRAKAHWGIFTSEHIVSHLRIAGSPIIAVPIWRFSNGGLTHEQGVAMTPENYIEKLNAGSSRKAPMMFLDTVAEQESSQFALEAGKLVEEIF